MKFESLHINIFIDIFSYVEIILNLITDQTEDLIGVLSNLNNTNSNIIYHELLYNIYPTCLGTFILKP